MQSQEIIENELEHLNKMGDDKQLCLTTCSDAWQVSYALQRVLGIISDTPHHRLADVDEAIQEVEERYFDT